MVREIVLATGASHAPAGTIAETLKGEVFVLRGGLQAYGLLEPLREATLKAIAASVGQEAADRAAREGFQHIHNWVSPKDIPEMTEAVYRAIEPLAQRFLIDYVSKAFPDAGTLYYEETPNVRFHIPYDIARAHANDFKSFSEARGEGKITAHGPHRDSWLDCPSNGVNLWFAIGPVRRGNGLTVYARNYGGTFKYKASGDIAEGESLSPPETFDLEPGDCILFHTDQVHGSELNRINETRFVISFRMAFEKPHFPNRHFHRYVRADLVDSPLSFLAAAPAMLQPSYVRSLIQRAQEKLVGRPPDAPAAPPEMIGVEANGLVTVDLAKVPVGSVRGLTKTLCVARLSETDIVAVSRRCPHAGGDLANGWAEHGKIVCPWHNLPFDPATGRSPCSTLPPLHRVDCRVVDGRIIVDPAKVLGRVQPEPA
ncbi:MAG: Rieske 2Fe-2S domain-containing protein [Alphaproteobacteria bacterium]|nr:Rieske 2Fe-2S domain-containing protein [Alphaproteobacteria bacterium]